MSSSPASAASPLRRAQDLYDHHQYLDAYALTKQYWTSATDLQQLSTDELIFAGRLASRLGGWRVSRWICRHAAERDPANPRVRYFTRHVRASRYRLLEDLKAFRANPDVGGDDLGVRASWLASYAYAWATLRDFDTAYWCLEQAHSLAPNDGWVLTCESDVHGMADRWVDALKSAERAWGVDPGSPFAANSLGASLLNLGRVQESADRLFTAAENTQSYQLTLDACWHQCALAETLEGSQKAAALECARVLAKKFPQLAVLADRESRAQIARAQLDIADLADDYDEIERWTNEVHSPFHRQLLANLKRNPSGKRIRLHFQRKIQKHQACVPTSVATVLSATGIHVSEDEIAAEVTFGGTHEWAAADWLRSRGLHVRFFPLTAALAASLIQHQIAFVLSWDADESGHAVAAVGLDERAGTLLIHDPQSFRGTEYLLEGIDRNASPVGLKGMAFVPADRAAELDGLLPTEAAVLEAAQEHQKAFFEMRPSDAREIVAALACKFPDHPGTIYLQAVQEVEDGHIGKAFSLFRGLLRQFPTSPAVRVRFIFACRSLGNTALLRETLRNIVEAGRLPGLDAQQDWVLPPDRYVFEYADLLRLSDDTRDRAESLLHSLIRRRPGSAGAWHNLADLLWQKRDMESALLCFRFASFLCESDEHYARAYADVLAGEKREEEAFKFLESRARKYGYNSLAVGTWSSWIETLEDRGYPERALQACNEALAVHSESPELLAFATPFLSRMGDWNRAEECLSRLRSTGNIVACCEASVHFHRMRGDLDQAMQNAELWIREVPRSIDARYAALELIRMRDGYETAVRTAKRWLAESGNNEDFERAYCSQLDSASSPKWKKYSVLLRRIKRNPDDAWAWREITYDCLGDYDLAETHRHPRFHQRISRFLSECDRTSADNVATIRAHALWQEFSGRWQEAVQLSIRAIELDPGAFYSYRRVWECSARLPHAERAELWKQIEPKLLASAGRLSIARQVMALLAERFGPVEAERTIEKWQEARPQDPDVIEAAADLLIEHGHGRSDALRAITLLQPSVGRYPYHVGLRFSLASAHRRAGQDSEAEAVLAEIVRRCPDNQAAKIQLAWIRHSRRDKVGAGELIDSARRSNPRNSEVADARAQMLIDDGRFEEARALIEQTLAELPDDVTWRRRSIAMLMQCGAMDKAVQAARDGIKVYPRGAYLWLLLGRTLNELRQYAEVGEIERCLRKSLQLNASLFESADLLAIFLADQRRYEIAVQVIREIEPRLGDPSAALGRLAWIKRVQGQNQEAISDLASAVSAAPWYGWGWGLLIEWLEEDKEWERARQLLQEIPPPLFTDTQFRLRRLLLLEKAGLERGQLDQEWRDLLKDFPEDVSLHVRRYDSLRSAEKFNEAAAVLDGIEPMDPDNPYILARRVEVLERQGKRQDAIQTALRVCFAAVEESTWPAARVWEIAQQGLFAEELFRQTCTRLAAGDRPTITAFANTVSHAIAGETKRERQPRFAVWFPRGGAREVVRLFDLLDELTWEASNYRSQVYTTLSDFGYERLVRKLWKKRNAGNIGVEEWCQIGRALTGARLHSEARKFLSGWRDRPGVPMWVIANYLISLRWFGRSQQAERIRTCRDALAGLPHDHCAKYLAHLEAEACALLNDRQSLLEGWNTYSKYFNGEVEKDEYFRGSDRYLLREIPNLIQHLERNQSWRYRWDRWKLYAKRAFRQRQIATKTKSSVDIPWWFWWLLIVLLSQLLRNSG